MFKFLASCFIFLFFLAIIIPQFEQYKKEHNRQVNNEELNNKEQSEPEDHCVGMDKTQIKAEFVKWDNELDKYKMLEKRAKFQFDRGLITESQYTAVKRMRLSVGNNYLVYANCIEARGGYKAFGYK